MFIGHYGPAAAASNANIKFWHGFVAVQFLDILWAPFILLGIEKVRIVEGFTPSSPFDLYHMPYTHSLLMAAVWSVLAGVLYAAVRRSAGVRGGLIIGLLVMSHWVADYIMHVPDLPLYIGGPEVGLGLWNNRPLTIIVELGLFLGGFWLYLRASRARSSLGVILTLSTLFVMVAAQLYGNFGPIPSSPQAAAMSGIVCYLLFAGLAAAMDSLRTAKGQ